MNAYEVNFDGIVGPTHNYAGLSAGNLASTRNRRAISNPRKAALQGLAKMKLLAGLGLKQAVLPPQERPDVRTLRRLGFAGSDAQVIENAAREAPALLAMCYSASGMWTANAATVSPSADTGDGRVHFTPANLATYAHRALEPAATAAVLRRIFADESCFAHHDPLPPGTQFDDEGAANHTRLCGGFAEAGVEVFAFGRDPGNPSLPRPRRYPARQTRDASAAVARLHRLDPAQTLLVQQNPRAIDAGVFHNDVISVGNQHVLLYHEAAFVNTPTVVKAMARALRRYAGVELLPIRVPARRVSLATAVSSYLFNSQLLTLSDGSMLLLCPSECHKMKPTRQFLEELPQRHPIISRTEYVDLRQSMRNGGGPACLRLRVVLTEDELAHVAPGVLLTDALYDRLTAWVRRRYRESLAPADLADPELMEESRAALDELTRILELRPLWPFQSARA